MAGEVSTQNSCCDIAINVLDPSLVNPIKKRLAATTGPSLPNVWPTIYRVPSRIRNVDKEAYEPQLISIGPLHYDKESLKPAEEHKWRYLRAILSRNGTVSVEDYLKEIKALEAQALSSYAESIELNSNEFVKMMLLDGCFIVELFYKFWKEDGNGDPIFTIGSLLRSVCEDMLLLENQLPFCILQRIFSLVWRDEPSNGLLEKAIGFFDNVLALPLNRHAAGVKSYDAYHHLLDLIHSRCLPYNPMPSKNNVKLKQQSIPSAEKLKESGVKFKRKKDAEGLLNVEFECGVMAIPHLYIHGMSNCLFRNFIALEQCCPTTGSYFTVYADFLDCIISTKADVEILSDNGIIEHALGSDEELALLFNKMAKGTSFRTDENYLSSVFNDVNKYCETKWHKWQANLNHDYFKNPWSIMALIATIVALFLTAIQAFFAAYAYAYPPSQS